MIAAIMQPYFFPYLGYFQLMAAVDVFVFYDDAQYITRGWVNRNRIRVGNTASWLTLPIAGASARLPINQRDYLLDTGCIRVKNQLSAAYRTAPSYSDAAPELCRLLDFDKPNVADFNANLLTRLARGMGLDCEFRLASGIGVPAALSGADRIIEMCRSIGASAYVNPIGGSQLYDDEQFRAAGIDLVFLKTRIEPEQVGNALEHLSVVDLLMHGGIPACATRLPCYELVGPG